MSKVIILHKNLLNTLTCRFLIVNIEARFREGKYNILLRFSNINFNKN